MQSIRSQESASSIIRFLRDSEGGLTLDELAQKMNVSRNAMANTVKDLLCYETLQKTTNKKMVFNPNYQSFVGLYLTEDKINLSIIDLAGNEIHSNMEKIANYSSYLEAFVETLKDIKIGNIAAVSICSDEYLSDRNTAIFINGKFIISKSHISDFVPKGIKTYCEKMCVTETWNWYDCSDITDSELNVVFTFDENYCYYTIMKDGIIVQTIRYSAIPKKTEDFFSDIILSTWRCINPTKMIFIVRSSELLNLIEKNMVIWQLKMNNIAFTINEKFDDRLSPLLIAKKQCFYPSKSAAIHAMYSYYGWTN